MQLPSFFTRYLSAKWNPHQHCGMLYFHRILDEPDPFFPDDLTQAQFRQLLHCLTPMFEVITPDIWWHGGTTTHKPKIMISFDDGYEDNVLAARVLEEFGVRGTFFISTAGAAAGGAAQSLWQNKVLAHFRLKYHDANNQERSNLIQKCNQTLRFLKRQSPSVIAENTYELTRGDYSGLDLLDPSHIRRLIRNGHCVGLHTHNHYILSTLSDEQLYYEIHHSIHVLKEIAPNYQPRFFAYPNGEPGVDFNFSHIQHIQQAGFSAAFSSKDGGFPASPIQCNKNELFQLPRFLPHQKNAFLRSLSALKIAGESDWRQRVIKESCTNYHLALSPACSEQQSQGCITHG